MDKPRTKHEQTYSTVEPANADETGLRLREDTPQMPVLTVQSGFGSSTWTRIKTFPLDEIRQPRKNFLYAERYLRADFE